MVDKRAAVCYNRLSMKGHVVTAGNPGGMMANLSIRMTLKGLLLLALGAGVAGAAEHNVRQYGAKGDGVARDTAAIQAAIDAAAAAGGGTVLVPPGKYAIARIELKSGVTLHLDKGAMLLGSTQRKDYAHGQSAIVFARDAHQLAVEGEGAINGQVTADYGSRWGAPTVPAFRTGLVRLEDCRDVAFRGVTLMNSDSWTLHLRGCRHVRIEGIEILDNYKRLNSDGIDPNSCTDLKISHCHIVTGDDAIVLKSTEPRPCEDIEVSDCLLESATAALKIGTETKGDFRNIRFHNCKIVNSPVGVGFYIKDGAVVQDVVAEKIEMTLCGPTFHSVVPLYIDIEKRHADSKIGAVRNVVFRDIHITGGTGLLLQGMPESLLQDVTLKDITFDVKEAQDYAKRKKPVGGHRTTHDARDTLYARAATWAAVANVKGLVVDGFHVTIGADDSKKFPRSAMSLFNVKDGQILDVTRAPAAAAPPVVVLSNCKQVSVARPGSP
jgi:polygalacturonase